MSVKINDPKVSYVSLDISGGTDYTLKRGSSTETTLAPTVRAVYEDESSEALNINIVSWSGSSDGISITSSDGKIILNAGMNATTGSHALKVTAAASYSGKTGTATKDLTINITSSGNVAKNQNDSENADDNNGSHSKRVTTFKEKESDNDNADGFIFASADLTLTTASTDFKGIEGVSFSIPVSVDVKISQDSRYYNYTSFDLSLDVTGLDWLKVSGDSLIKNLSLESHDFKFTLTGTPTELATNAPVKILATVIISGDTPVLIASVDKEIKISIVENKVTSLDVKLSGEKTLSLDYNKSGSVTQMATVTAKYLDGTSNDVTNDATITWSADSLPDGFKLNNGVLSIDAGTKSGDYSVKVIATATYGGVKNSADITVNVKINSPKFSYVSLDISGGTDYTLKRGSSTETTLAPIVKAVYEDESFEELDANIVSWSGSSDGISITSSDGKIILNAGMNATTGSHALKVTATASYSGKTGTATKDLTINVTSSGNVAKNQNDSENADDNNGSHSKRVTTFKEKESDNDNADGFIFASADLTLTTASTDFKGIEGVSFSIPVSVDVKISQDSRYYNYTSFDLSLDVTGLDWLKVSGDSLIKNLSLESHDFKFTLTGTPTELATNAPVKILATVIISGDTPVLIASVDKEIKISIVENKVTSLDVKLSGEKTLSLDYNKSGSVTQMATVTAKYLDGTSNDVTNDATITWSADSLPDGFKLNNGVLSIDAGTKSGDYTVKVIATATYGGAKNSADVTVSVKINDPKVSSLSVNITDNANLTLKRGSSKTLAATVSAVYEDSRVETLNQSDYSLTWSGSADGFTISNGGVLTASMRASTGTHNITIRATATSGNFSNYVEKTFAVNVTSSGNTSQSSTKSEESQDDKQKSRKIIRYEEEDENGIDSVVFASVDIAVATTSNDFSIENGKLLAIPVSVEISISNDSAINEISDYSLSLDVSGLDWLKVSGDSLIENISLESHDLNFILAGTPAATADKTNVNIVAYVVLTGDLELAASCDKNISVDVYEHAVTLDSLEIDTGNRTLTADKGKESSLTLSADVYGIYSDTTREKISGAAVTWSAVGSLPAGITLNGNVLTVGAATASGDHNLTLRASVTYNNLTATKDIAAAITVKAPSVTLSLTPATAALTVSHDATATAVFSATATAAYINGTENLTPAYTLEPQYSWLSISSTGTITATPTASSPSAGDYSVTVKATASADGVVQTATATLNVKVNKSVKEVSVSFVPTTPTTLSVTHGATATTAAFTAMTYTKYSDGMTTSNPNLAAYSFESNHTWITFNASTRTITASPTSSVKAGNYTVKVKAAATVEGITNTAETTLTVTVTKKLTGITLMFDAKYSPTELSVTQGETQTAAYRASALAGYSDGTNKVLTKTWTLEPSYSWLTVSDSGVVTAKPTTAVNPGTYNVKVKVTASAEGDTQTRDTTLAVTVAKTDVEKTLRDITVNFTSAPETLSMTHNETKTAVFTATATANYNDNSTEDLTPVFTFESDYSWITFDASTGTVTANPGNVVMAGNYSVKVKAVASLEGVTGTAEKTLTVAVGKTLKSITVFTPAALVNATLSVAVGESQSTAAIKAEATANFSNGSVSHLTPTISLESAYSWITFDDSTKKITASPTAGVSTGDYTVNVIFTAASDGVTRTEEWPLTVTVTPRAAPVPTSLTFDKASITMTLESGDSKSESVTVTFKDQYGDDMTAQGEITVSKAQTDYEWITFGVEGNKITFTAAPGADDKTSTQMFTVRFKYDGKEYLQTSYRVVVSISEVSGYSLTVSFPELTVFPGSTVSADLKQYVKLEKVFKNGSRETIEDAILTFSSASIEGASWIALDGNSGVLTLNPGEDMTTGSYNNFGCIVYASYNGKEVAEDYRLLSIKVVSRKPAITTASLPNGTVNSPYSQTMMATGDEPITWSITSGALPDGLTLDAGTGTISGTPTREGSFAFTVQASNAYGTDSRGFMITVVSVVQAPDTWKYSLTPDKGKTVKKNGIIAYKRKVAKGENVKYNCNKKNIPTGKYLYSVFFWDKADGAVKAGEGYVNFKLKYLGATHDYEFKEKALLAENDAGTSYAPARTIIVTKKDNSTLGTISLSALGNEDGGVITLADGEDDDGEELSGTMYFDDGGTDEDGNITGVIGGTSEYKTLDEFKASLSEDEYPKVIRLEFRSGAEVTSITAADLEIFTGLLELSAAESTTLESVNLSGNTVLESLELFNCPALKSLNVNGCEALSHLEAAQCPKLTDLDVDGCKSLASLWLNGSSVTELNLSGSDFANVSDIDLTSCNSLTSLNVDGCAALENLYAPYTAVTELNLKNNPELTDLFLNETKVAALDLSKNSKLKTLSLVGATELEDLKLADGVVLDEFEITNSKITELDYTDNSNITSLDLSSNTELKTLNLTNCSSLVYLNLNGLAQISNLTLTGCYSLEKLEAAGCEKLENLNLDDCPSLKEIYLSGAGVKILDVGACGGLVSLDVSACVNLTSLNAKGCSLVWLNVTGCEKLSELDCSNNQLGWLNLDGLTALVTVDYSGQKIYGWTSDTRLNLSLCIGGNDIGRVADVLAYDSNELGIETTIEDENGNVYTSDSEYYAVFEKVPAKVVYYYDTYFGDGEPMDVTITGEAQPDGFGSLGGSSGGCEVGLGGLALLVLGLLLAKKR